MTLPDVDERLREGEYPRDTQVIRTTQNLSAGSPESRRRRDFLLTDDTTVAAHVTARGQAVVRDREVLVAETEDESSTSPRTLNPEGTATCRRPGSGSPSSASVEHGSGRRCVVAAAPG
jgi:hypothetical protein